MHLENKINITIKELMDMQGHRALVTGAGGNLGRVIADTLGELGCDLILLDRSPQNLDLIAEEMRSRWGVAVQAVRCDLELASERAKLIHSLLIDDKPLHTLINNAAFVGSSDLDGWAVPFEQQRLDTWGRAIEVNLTATFDLCQGLSPKLKANKNATIINIGSIYGEFGPDWSLYDGTAMANPAAYAASKGGLLQLTRWLATTLSPQVRVNAISPGGIERGQSKLFVDRYESRTPLRRMAREDDFRGAVAYLATRMSSYVTGHNLRVDGGWGIW